MALRASGRHETERAPLVRVGKDAESDFTAFYAAEYRRALSVAMSLSRDWCAAEEMTQEAFVRGLKRWHVLSRMDRPDLWLRRVLINLSRSRLRRMRTESRALARLSREEPYDVAGLHEETQACLAAIRRLPARQAEAIALHYFGGLPVQDVARVMHCSPGTVKAHLHAGRNKLGERMLATGGTQW